MRFLCNSLQAASSRRLRAVQARSRKQQQMDYDRGLYDGAQIDIWDPLVS